MPVLARCECCGQQVIKPDPPEAIRSMDQRFATERAWDKAIAAGYNERKSDGKAQS